MAKYLIHAMPKRMWYVEEFLIPSLINQGIEQDNIHVYNDINGEGNLISCMKAFASCEGNGGTWHLQDDVCISADFKQKTEENDLGIVCGFSSAMYDGTEDRIGIVSRDKSWFSFPCIRIPNFMARECSEWVLTQIIGNPVYESYWRKGANDDWAFRQYLSTFQKDVKVNNLAPNVVNHIDYLIGGGTGNKKRKEHCVSQYWEDDSIIKKLEESINGRKR